MGEVLGWRDVGGRLLKREVITTYIEFGDDNKRSRNREEIVNLRDISNGPVIGSRDRSYSSTSTKTYKSSLIDDFIPIDCSICPTPCITSCDSVWIHYSSWICTFPTSFHALHQLPLLCWCIFPSRVSSFLYSTYFIFSLSLLCKSYFFPTMYSTATLISPS